MVRRFYDLPSLTTLAIFEASARHLSFKLAAKELNVTPSAVSRQIKILEDEIGLPVFVRTGIGVALTQEGEELYGVLAGGFSKASETVRSLKRGDRARNVTIACSDAFATMWLIPRMPDFWKRYPEISVDHLITDNAKDYRRAEVQLRVRYGSGVWLDESAEFLFDDLIFPVCGPGFAEQHKDATADDLINLPSLRVDPDWSGWEEILLRVKIPDNQSGSKRFSKFTVAMQAAMADQGVAVGWNRLIRPLIEEGKLVRFTDMIIPAAGAYYITTNSHRDLTGAATVLRDWLREMAEKERLRETPQSSATTEGR